MVENPGHIVPRFYAVKASSYTFFDRDEATPNACSTGAGN
jgi:hypothetical protein